jgi:hypothetical protein
MFFFSSTSNSMGFVSYTQANGLCVRWPMFNRCWLHCHTIFACALYGNFLRRVLCTVTDEMHISTRTSSFAWVVLSWPNRWSLFFHLFYYATTFNRLVCVILPWLIFFIFFVIGNLAICIVCAYFFACRCDCPQSFKLLQI